MITPSSAALARIPSVFGSPDALSAADAAPLLRDERGLDRGAAGKLP